MRTRTALFPLAIVILACTGPATDTGSSSADTGEAGPEAGVHQTQSCRDYLDCAQSAIPDDYAKLNKKYGASGSCWESTTEQMQRCDGECEAGIADLEDTYGASCESGDTGPGDTADTGSGGNDCALAPGTWSSELSFDVDGCGAAELLAFDGVTCSGGDNTVVFSVIGLELPCTASGKNVECGTDAGFYFLFSGTTNAGTTWNGDFSIGDGGCTSSGSFSAAKR